MEWGNLTTDVTCGYFIMARKHTQIDIYAEKFIRELPPHQQIEVDECGFMSLGARIIREKLKEFYDGTEAAPPTIDAVIDWFYRDPPHWAVAILANLSR